MLYAMKKPPKTVKNINGVEIGMTKISPAIMLCYPFRLLDKAIG